MRPTTACVFIHLHSHAMLVQCQQCTHGVRIHGVHQQRQRRPIAREGAMCNQMSRHALPVQFLGALSVRQRVLCMHTRPTWLSVFAAVCTHTPLALR